MYNHPKHKNLPSNVRGILINKSRSQNNTLKSNEDNAQSEINSVSKTAAYFEAKDIIRSIDRWALMQYNSNNNDETRLKETQEKLSDLKDGLSLAIEIADDNGIDSKFLKEISEHRVFDENVNNPYDLQ